jgi:uncharacterized membrane protein YcaP (DUF421 family)
METVREWIGEGENLSVAQMCFRIVIIFIVGLLLVRLSGRRTFGMNMSLDNVITILLGGILSRGIDGKTSFPGVIAVSALIIILYRLVNWGCVYSERFGYLIKGKDKIIFKDGKLDKDLMKQFMITEKDLQERIRLSAHLDSYEKIKEIYIERDGNVSIIKKEG